MQKQPPADSTISCFTTDEHNAIAAMQQRLKDIKRPLYGAVGMLIAFPPGGELIPVRNIKAYRSLKEAFDTIGKFDPEVPLSREQSGKLVAAMHLLEPNPDAQQAPADEKALLDNTKAKERDTYIAYRTVILNSDAIYGQDTPSLMQAAFGAIRRRIAEQAADKGDKGDFEDRFGDRSSRGTRPAR